MARHLRRNPGSLPGQVPPGGTEAAEPGPARPGGPAEETASGTDRWGPVIVGDPTFDFEPQPPAAASYRPDTIFDGWSADRVTVRAASVRGYSHRYRGIPRQDDAEVAFHQASGTVLFAVADGVSGASQSHLGATAACQTAISTLRWQLESTGIPDWDEVIRDTTDELSYQAAWLLGSDERPDLAAVEKLVATTLTAGYAVPDGHDLRAAVVQVGDSGAWVLHKDRYHPVGSPKIDPRQQVTSSAVTALPRTPAAIRPVQITLPPDAVLLIGTDGFGDALGDGDGRVGQLFARHLAVPPPARALAHLLDFSRETFDDDRTLIAVWPRPAGRGESR
jgi:hypothetical protein